MKSQKELITRSSTLLLKTIISLFGLGIVIICLLTLSMLLRGQVGMYSPILIGVYVTTVPFFYALFQAIKLLTYIDRNQAFSQASVNALKNIKFSAMAIVTMYLLGLPYVYLVADKDDSPGSLAVAIIITFVTFVVAVFVAVAQRLFQNAVDIKHENDLTV